MNNNINMDLCDVAVKNVLSDLSVRLTAKNTYTLYYCSKEIGLSIHYPSKKQILFNCSIERFPNSALFTSDIFFRAILIKTIIFCEDMYAGELVLNKVHGFLGAKKHMKNGFHIFLI